MTNWWRGIGLFHLISVLVYGEKKIDFFAQFVYWYIYTGKWQTGEKELTFLPDLFTSINKLFFILANDKLAKRKLTFLPDLFTSVFKLFVYW